MDDIVVDTNIFVHAGNPDEEIWQPPSVAFLTALLKSATNLCVDEGFSLNQADNKSLIGYEFLEKLRAGSLGLAIITTLAGTERLKLLPRRVDQGTGKKIRQKVSNKRDRTFIQVTCNSTERTMASHDYDDMPPTIRAYFRKAIDVLICSAAEATPLIS